MLGVCIDRWLLVGKPFSCRVFVHVSLRGFFSFRDLAIEVGYGWFDFLFAGLVAIT